MYIFWIVFFLIFSNSHAILIRQNFGWDVFSADAGGHWQFFVSETNMFYVAEVAEGFTSKLW